MESSFQEVRYGFVLDFSKEDSNMVVLKEDEWTGLCSYLGFQFLW